MTTMTKIKRAVAGGYIKADMTGTGDWEVGRITHFDQNFIYFNSLVDGEEAKIHREEAYKATAKEFDEFAAKQDSDIKTKKYDAEAAGRERQAKDRAELDAEKQPGQRKLIRQDGHVCNKCEQKAMRRMANRNEQGHTHRCAACGHTQYLATRNLLEDYMDKYEVREERTVSGRKCQDSGDPVASHLRGMDIAEVYELAAEIMTKSGYDTVSAAELEERYGHLNLGMQRMNCGNRIRAAIRETGVEFESFTK